MRIFKNLLGRIKKRLALRYQRNQLAKRQAHNREQVKLILQGLEDRGY